MLWATPLPTKKIKPPTAGFTEMILVPIGVSRVTKSKLLKSVPITDILAGPNTDSSVPGMVLGKKAILSEKFSIK